jgi:rod shape determining protein RodA
MGVLAYFFFQMLINIGMNMGLFPITGIVLPFLSYGGSALISSFFLLGLIP